MDTIESAQAEYDEALKARDEAVSAVRTALVSRAPQWLQWCAFEVADNNAAMVLDRGLAQDIKLAAQSAGARAAQHFESSDLDYTRSRLARQGISFAGCVALVDAEARPFAQELLDGLEAMELQLPVSHTSHASLLNVSDFNGTDDLHTLLYAWAHTQSDLKEAKKAVDAKITAEYKGSLRSQLIEAWGEEPPANIKPRDPGTSTNW